MLYTRILWVCVAVTAASMAWMVWAPNTSKADERKAIKADRQASTSTRSSTADGETACDFLTEAPARPSSTRPAGSARPSCPAVFEQTLKLGGRKVLAVASEIRVRKVDLNGDGASVDAARRRPGLRRRPAEGRRQVEDRQPAEGLAPRRRQLPERRRSARRPQHRLRLVARARRPVGLQAVAVPRLRQLVELRDRHAAPPSGTSSSDRRSRIVRQVSSMSSHQSRGRDRDVEPGVLGDLRHRERTASRRQRRRSLPPAERRDDPKRVPRAVAPPLRGRPGPGRAPARGGRRRGGRSRCGRREGRRRAPPRARPARRAARRKRRAAAVRP